MKKLILASVSALALFGVAACSDSTDNTTTQSTTPPATEQPMPSRDSGNADACDRRQHDRARPDACAGAVNALHDSAKQAGSSRPFQ